MLWVVLLIPPDEFMTDVEHITIFFFSKCTWRFSVIWTSEAVRKLFNTILPNALMLYNVLLLYSLIQEVQESVATNVRCFQGAVIHSGVHSSCVNCRAPTPPPARSEHQSRGIPWLCTKSVYTERASEEGGVTVLLRLIASAAILPCAYVWYLGLCMHERWSQPFIRPRREKDGEGLIGGKRVPSGVGGRLTHRTLEQVGVLNAAGVGGVIPGRTVPSLWPSVIDLYASYCRGEQHEYPF